MYFFQIANIVLILLSLCSFLSCSSPTDLDYSDIVFMAGIPVITGFYVTTDELPDGTGEVIGNPAYTIKNINVFPNPFSGIEPFPYSNGPYIFFSHLPQSKVTIIIVNGMSEFEARTLSNSYLGTSYIQNGVAVIKTIIKQGNSQFERWDFRDEDENVVESGYYRAYFFGNGIPDNYFLDLSITLEPNWLKRY